MPFPSSGLMQVKEVNPFPSSGMMQVKEVNAISIIWVDASEGSKCHFHHLG